MTYDDIIIVMERSATVKNSERCIFKLAFRHYEGRHLVHYVMGEEFLTEAAANERRFQIDQATKRAWSRWGHRAVRRITEAQS